MNDCYWTGCTATACKATPCKSQPIEECDLVYLAAASIAAPLLATKGESRVVDVANAAIRMAEEIRSAQWRLGSTRSEAQVKKRVEAENRRFRATASKATLELHDRLRQQYGLGSRAETD